MHILLVGLGREGWSSFQFFLNNFPPETKFELVDDQVRGNLVKKWQTTEIDQLVVNQRIQFWTTNSFLENFALNSNELIAVVSPGIPPRHSLVEWLDRAGVPQTSNTQLFFDIAMPDRATNSNLELPKLLQQPILIGVTGTKGKSTTTAAIHHVLRSAGVPTVLGGNIGVPPLDLVKSLQTNVTERTYVVLELSCHQLAQLTTSPHIAVVMSITPEHLDYYPDFAQYQKAKAAICRYQNKEDLVIYASDNEAATQIAQLSPGTKLTIPQVSPVIAASSLKLVGQHNYHNVLPSVLISLRLGITPQVIQASLIDFAGLPHRLQLVAEHNQVRYYNDSLATTPEATIAAIQSFEGQSIILIAGGFDRGLDYVQLARAIDSSSVKAVLLLPTTGEKIAQQLHKVTPVDLLVEEVPDLTTAVERAKQLATPEDVVLLSPASASFNQFKDYAERGEAFIKLVTP